MTRFFFDIVREKTCAHDFHGRYLRSVDEARDVAETVSLDLALERDESAGSEIHVRDTMGALLFAVKVRPTEMVFA
jgi:hypothetical protein